MVNISLGRTRELHDQLFPTPGSLTAEAVYLAFWSIAFFVALHRFRRAPAMGWMLLFTATQVVAFGVRIWVWEHPIYSLELFRAQLALLAIGFLFLLETLLVLVGEHFNTVTDHYGRRHRTFIHFLSFLLLGAFVTAVYYSCRVRTVELDGTIQAYIVLVMVFLGLLLLHQLFRTYHLAHYPTTVFLFTLSLILVVPPIYLELRHEATTPWLASSSTPFYVLCYAFSTHLSAPFSSAAGLADIEARPPGSYLKQW